MNGEDALRERIAGVEKMMLALRSADQEAVRVLAEDVKEKFTGFPAEYARKGDLEAIRDTADRLDKSAMTVKDFESAHESLEMIVREKLSENVFEATRQEWAVWRASVDHRIEEAIKAAAIVAATEAGSQVTWQKIAFFVGLATALIILSRYVIPL